MGWNPFASKYVHSVGTSFARMVDDDSIPDTTRVAVIKAIFRNESISQHLVDSRLNGTKMQINRMLRFAKTDNTSSLPNSLIVSNSTGRREVKEAVESFEGKSVTIDYVSLGELNNTHLAWQKLVDEYDYNHETNEIEKLSSEIGKPVYLEDFVSIYPINSVMEEGALESLGYPQSWGYTPERIGGNTGRYKRHTDFILSDKNENGAEVTYTYIDQEEVTPAVVEDEVVVTEAVTKEVRKSVTLKWSFNPEVGEMFIHAMYHFGVGENKQTKYWTYCQGDGVYPVLDNLTEANYEAVHKYMPVVFFNSLRKSVTTEDQWDTDRYKANKKMLNYLNMDYQEIANSIAENPDADKLEQAVLGFGVPINSENPVELQYLYMFFEDLYFKNPSTTIASNTANGKTGSALVMQLDDLKYVLSYGKITKTMQGGKIKEDAEPGDVISELGTESYTQQYQQRYSGSGEIRTVTEYAIKDFHYRAFKKQVTAFLYEEVRVYDLKSKFRIYRSYDSIQTIKEQENESAALIFLDQNLLEAFSDKEKETLYLRSMHLILNSRETQKVKFYERKIFGDLLKIAAIAFAIYSGGQSLHLLAVAATISVTAVMVVIAVMVFEYIVVPYLFSLVVKELGMENSLILAAAIAIYSIYTGKGAQGIPGAPFAIDLMTVSNGLTNGIQSELERLFSNYQSDVEAFNLMADKATAEMDAAKDLLDMDSVIDPFEFIGREPIIIEGETPDEFYNRTIHTQNIGTLTNEAITSFVEISLKLPDFNDTAGA